MGLMTARPSSAKFSEQNPYFLDTEELPHWKNLFGNCQPLKLEIGFGEGDFLIEMAIKEAHSNFIGIDFSESGTLKLLNQIKNLQLNNIRVVYGDARNKIPLLFRDGELDTVYINFPDPWPRKRHTRRRLIKPEFVSLVAQKLTPEGHVHLATDSKLYAQKIFDYFNAESLFQNINLESGFLENRNNLPRTKYEKNFIYTDEKIYYLEYLRLARDGKAQKLHKNSSSTYIETNQSQQTQIKANNQDSLLVGQFETDEVKSKDACDLKKVADNLVAAGDQKLAIQVYKKVEDKAQDTLDFNWLAYSISETLGDKNWARKVFKKAENKAENSLEFNWLAYSIFETLGDKNWAKIVYKKAESKPGNIREMCDLADSISETLGDKKWVGEIYKKAEDAAAEYSDFYELADIMYEKLGDKQKAMALYKKAESKAEDSSDLHSLAERLYENLDDKAWAREIYTKAEGKANDSGDFCGLADSLLKNLGDEEWAIKLYKRAAGRAGESDELRELADSLLKNLGDEEWAKKLYKKSEEKAEAFYEFRWLAECLCENLGDREWAKKVYKKAEHKAKDPSEFNHLTSSIYKKLDVAPAKL